MSNDEDSRLIITKERAPDCALPSCTVRDADKKKPRNHQIRNKGYLGIAFPPRPVTFSLSRSPLEETVLTYTSKLALSKHVKVQSPALPSAFLSTACSPHTGPLARFTQKNSYLLPHFKASLPSWCLSGLSCCQSRRLMGKLTLGWPLAARGENDGEDVCLETSPNREESYQFAGINLLISPYWLVLFAVVMLHDIRLTSFLCSAATEQVVEEQQPLCSVHHCALLRLRSSRLKGKWAVSLSIDRYSFHPTVFSKKAENRIGGAAVSGAGVRPDLLRGHESPIQSVIKHTAQPADHTPPSGLSPGCCRPPLPGIKHRAAASPALGYQPGCLITKTHRAKQ